MPILIGGFIFRGALLIEFLEHTYHFHGCQHGLYTVILLFLQGTEQSHQAISNDLVYDSPMACNGSEHGRKIGIQ